MFELARKLLTAVVVAVYFAIAPSEIPAWRAEPRSAPAAVWLLDAPGLAYLPHR